MSTPPNSQSPDHSRRDWDGVARTVQNQLLGLFWDARKVQESARIAGTKHFMMDGLIPRLHQNYYMLGRINEIMPAGRRRVLVELEPIEVEVLLNAYYVNIVASMDSLAFAVCYEFEVLSKEVNRRQFQSVSLFGRAFLASLGTVRPALRIRIESFREWNARLRKRRDPAAHRLPWRLRPRSLTDEEMGQVASLIQELHNAPNEFERALRDLARLGAPAPVFAENYQSPSNGDPIYPTILDDSTQLIRLTKTILAEIRTATT